VKNGLTDPLADTCPTELMFRERLLAGSRVCQLSRALR
jgi:hypothetical protein